MFSVFLLLLNSSFSVDALLRSYMLDIKTNVSRFVHIRMEKLFLTLRAEYLESLIQGQFNQIACSLASQLPKESQLGLCIG